MVTLKNNMAFIYTIQHPITDDIVYVGCTKDIVSRIKSHIQSRKENANITKYINNLRKNYLYPKILVLEEVEEMDMFISEMFWIRMIKSWGFDLLNTFKVKPPKEKMYLSNKFSYTGNSIERKSKEWSIEDFEIGKEFNVENTRSKRNCFYTVFRSNAKILGLVRFLKFNEVSDGLLIATVVDKKPLKGPKLYIKKGYRKAEERKSYNSTFDPLKEIGASIEVNINNEMGFRTLKSKVSYHLRSIKPKRMNYIRISSNVVKIIRIY